MQNDFFYFLEFTREFVSVTSSGHDSQAEAIIGLRHCKMLRLH